MIIIIFYVNADQIVKFDMGGIGIKTRIKIRKILFICYNFATMRIKSVFKFTRNL